MSTSLKDGRKEGRRRKMKEEGGKMKEGRKMKGGIKMEEQVIWGRKEGRGKEGTYHIVSVDTSEPIRAPMLTSLKDGRKEGRKMKEGRRMKEGWKEGRKEER